MTLFWPILETSSPMCYLMTLAGQVPPGVTWQFSFYRKYCILKAFAEKCSSKMDEKIKHDIFWLTPLPTVSFGDTVANPPPPPLAVLRIIWMAPFVITEILDLLHRYPKHRRWLWQPVPEMLRQRSNQVKAVFKYLEL